MSVVPVVGVTLSRARNFSWRLVGESGCDTKLHLMGVLSPPVEPVLEPGIAGVSSALLESIEPSMLVFSAFAVMGIRVKIKRPIRSVLKITVPDLLGLKALSFVLLKAQSYTRGLYKLK